MICWRAELEIHLPRRGANIVIQRLTFLQIVLLAFIYVLRLSSWYQYALQPGLPYCVPNLSLAFLTSS